MKSMKSLPFSDLSLTKKLWFSTIHILIYKPDKISSQGYVYFYLSRLTANDPLWTVLNFLWVLLDEERRLGGRGDEENHD